ncbi:DUF2975 domain-containing protein [Mucilaginibacter lutimaris]|uniref:DUF2975 domain-containing protein n=1 Tax=Mucilaginibacter lutimaris TaxID=931629 RepID=A0ABW2ZF76_9SPHI
MKKIKTLQILVYIAFTLYFIQNYAPELYRGAIDGFNDYNNATDTAPAGPALISTLDGNIIQGVKRDTLRVGNDYLLRDISVSAHVRLTNPNIQAPEWIKTIQVLSGMLIINLLGYTAYHINKVIANIYNQHMFDITCIRLIRKIGFNILAYTITGFIYDWSYYIKQLKLIHPPLKVVNTLSFNYGAVLCAIFVFVIAEAFAQGSKLKEEQELTI